MIQKQNLVVFDSSVLNDDVVISNIQVMAEQDLLYKKIFFTNDIAKFIKEENFYEDDILLSKKLVELKEFETTASFFVVGDIEIFVKHIEKFRQKLVNNQKIVIVENCTVNFDAEVEDQLLTYPEVIINRI